jgi:hypothetical protein
VALSLTLIAGTLVTEAGKVTNKPFRTHLTKLARIMWVLSSQTLAVELHLTVYKSLLKSRQQQKNSCDPSYPDDCISPPPPLHLDCGDNGVPGNFEVLPPDPHGFDGDNDGIGCEDPNTEPEPQAEPEPE